MGKTIIFAEDNEISRLMFQNSIPHYLPEYQIEIYENGRTLQERLDLGSAGIVAVVTDNQMPEIYGSEVIATYAKKKEFEKIPFILVYCGPLEIGEKAKENGAYDYYMKPIKHKEFCDFLQTAIKEKANE